MESLLQYLPDKALPVFVTLAMSFLIGLEREEHSAGRSPLFGGVRTFPIIGLSGFMLAEISGGQPLLIVPGLLLLGSLLWLSYRKKLEISPTAGMTSEISGLFTFLMGALAYTGALWEATALSVLVLLLLELKKGLERLARRIPSGEIYTFTRFLLIAAVILPMIPRGEYTPFHISPSQIWLIVVVISGLSYASYVVGRWLGPGRSLLISSILGGLYSSTATTVMLAKRSKDESPTLVTGAMIVASGFMYLRLVVLLILFNLSLAKLLGWPFAITGGIAVLTGLLLTLRQKGSADSHHHLRDHPNPLELKAALLFALLFVAMQALTVLVREHVGTSGVYGLALLTGLTDVDPFVMSLTQNANVHVPLPLAAQSIVLAVAANNAIKAVYAFLWSSSKVRKQALISLLILSVLTLVPLLWL